MINLVSAVGVILKARRAWDGDVLTAIHGVAWVGSANVTIIAVDWSVQAAKNSVAGVDSAHASTTADGWVREVAASGSEAQVLSACVCIVAHNG